MTARQTNHILVNADVRQRFVPGFKHPIIFDNIKNSDWLE
jgi:hypothetical protein